MTKRKPTRWQWGVTADSKSCIVFNNGTAFEVLATDGGEGEYVGLGRRVKAKETTGTWRPIHMMPCPFIFATG